MSDTSWDASLPADSEQLEVLADDLGTWSDSYLAAADAMGQQGAPFAEAGTDLADAAWSTDAAADWSAWSEQSVGVADDYREQAAASLEQAARDAEMGWASSADYDLHQAAIAGEMAGEYDGQAASEATMSDGYLSDAGDSVLDAYDATSGYDAGSFDAGSFDAGSYDAGSYDAGSESYE